MEQKATKQHKTGQENTLARAVRFVTLEEVAVALGFHPRSVRRAMKSKRIPGRKISGRWFMTRADFETLLTPQLSLESDMHAVESPTKRYV